MELKIEMNNPLLDTKGKKDELNITIGELLADYLYNLSTTNPMVIVDFAKKLETNESIEIDVALYEQVLQIILQSNIPNKYKAQIQLSFERK